MQLLLNGLYWVFSGFFALLGKITAPSWVVDLVTGIAKYVIIANWYLPIDTFFVVALSVLGITVTLMVVSALLQLL